MNKLIIRALLKSVIVSFLTAGLLSTFLIMFNWWSAHIPTEVAQLRVLDGFASGALVDRDRADFDRVRGTHQYNDCLILSMILLRSGDPLRDALAPLIPVKDQNVPHHTSVCMMLRNLAEKTNPLEADVPLTRYHRYWHGLPAISARLLYYKTIEELRSNLKLAFYVSFGVVILVGTRQYRIANTTQEKLVGAGTATVGASLLAFWGGEYFAQSLTDAYPALALALFLVMTAWLRPMERSRTFIAFFAATFGTITIYLEFLSGPIPLGAAVLIATFALQAPAQEAWNKRALLLLTALVAYGSALVASYAAKMAATSLVIGRQLYFEAWSVLAERMSAKTPKWASEEESTFGFVDLINSLRWSFGQIAWGSNVLGYLLVLVAFMQLAAGATWLARNRKLQAPLSFAMAAVLLSALVVPAWYILFLNHSVIHSFFMVRLIVWPIAAGWLAMLIIILGISQRPPIGAENQGV